MQRRTRLLAALVFLVAAAYDGSPRMQAQARTARGRRANNVYIVQMASLPVGSYTGGIPGLPATKVPRGRKIDPDSAGVRSYVSYLQDRHDRTLGRAGGGRKVYDYHYSYDGF